MWWQIYTVGYAEDFWAVYGNLAPASGIAEGGSYHFFKVGSFFKKIMFVLLRLLFMFCRSMSSRSGRMKRTLREGNGSLFFKRVSFFPLKWTLRTSG